MFAVTDRNNQRLGIFDNRHQAEDRIDQIRSGVASKNKASVDGLSVVPFSEKDRATVEAEFRAMLPRARAHLEKEAARCHIVFDAQGNPKK
jgi:hypothetical protein